MNKTIADALTEQAKQEGQTEANSGEALLTEKEPAEAEKEYVESDSTAS